MKLTTLIGDGATLPAAWADIEIAGLTPDSREVRPGFLFAALPGTKLDGAAFVPAALAKGAIAILASNTAKLAVPDTVALIQDADPRRALALMAARYFEVQPATVVAVTGTNGKTSVVSFVRQIWAELGLQAASLGTVGLVIPAAENTSSHTTPEPVALHRLLARIAAEGVTHLAIEASSHGLQQRRLDGVRLAAAGFTNITRDHLDYHKDFEDYFAQKRRLFEVLLPKGAVAVLNADSDGSSRIGGFVRRMDARGLLTVGRKGETLRLTGVARDGLAQILDVMCQGKSYRIRLPLAGDFQASNALVAAALVIATGAAPERVLPTLERLRGAKGRLELVGATKAGAPAFVDYAHTPDALATVLDALRPHAERRLVVVFGCGGDRDQGKRPLMGAIAAAKADAVYVTDDNPRSELPATIRRAILAAAPGAIEIGDRQQAIETAVASLGPGDVLLVAGKGHESGQIVGGSVIPFSDHEALLHALRPA